MCSSPHVLLSVDATGPNPRMFLNAVENMTVAIRDPQKFQSLYKYFLLCVTVSGSTGSSAFISMEAMLSVSPPKRKVDFDKECLSPLSILTKSHLWLMDGLSLHSVIQVLYVVFPFLVGVWWCHSAVARAHSCKRPWRVADPVSCS